MSIIPPVTEMEWNVYNELKHNEYWNQIIEKKCIGTKKFEILSKFSEGDKAIIYDTFRVIDKMIHPNYDNINLHYYLMAIDKECNHANCTWIMAIKKIVKEIFDINIESTVQEKNLIYYGGKNVQV